MSQNQQPIAEAQSGATIISTRRIKSIKYPEKKPSDEGVGYMSIVNERNNPEDVPCELPLYQAYLKGKWWMRVRNEWQVSFNANGRVVQVREVAPETRAQPPKRNREVSAGKDEIEIMMAPPEGPAQIVTYPADFPLAQLPNVQGLVSENRLRLTPGMTLGRYEVARVELTRAHRTVILTVPSNDRD